PSSTFMAISPPGHGFSVFEEAGDCSTVRESQTLIPSEKLGELRDNSILPMPKSQIVDRDEMETHCAAIVGQQRGVYKYKEEVT
ncbi:MAG: hypothetical protein Q9173_003732, partial [Seirophora scorigena]